MVILIGYFPESNPDNRDGRRAGFCDPARKPGSKILKSGFRAELDFISE